MKIASISIGALVALLLLANCVCPAAENAAKDGYLVITAARLKPAFDELAGYRQDQGLPSGVITVEAIANSFPGQDLPEKIRACIASHYSNHHVRYVVVGGDDTVVPVRYGVRGGKTIPADLYYSDVDGKPWRNKNAEIDTNEDITGASLVPEVYYGRIPVRQLKEARDYIAKVKRYEACRDKGFIGSLLMTGPEGALPDDESETPDAAVPAKNGKLADIYTDHIKPVWQPATLKFVYAKPGGRRESKTDDYPRRLLAEWNRGYHVVIRMGHGNGFGWSGFHVDDALQLRNPVGSIVWSGGCGNGKYDADKDPTFSEALIRNPNGGAVAVFGHSRSVAGNVNCTAFWHALLDSKNETLGQVYVAVLRSVADKWATKPSGAYNFTFLGDPALRVRH